MLNELAKEIVEINKANGWDTSTHDTWHYKREVPTKLMLIVTETAEAMEAFRNDDYDNFVEEMADQIIRILDFTGGMGLDMDKAVRDKLEKNKLRGYRHGGKRV